jgi:predicted transcriptional regulator
LIDDGKNVSRSHRGNLDIIADILNASHGGVKKSYLMYRCNLSFKQLKGYSHLLLTGGLMRVTSRGTGSGLFEATEKGKTFLKAYKGLKALMK